MSDPSRAQGWAKAWPALALAGCLVAGALVLVVPRAPGPTITGDAPVDGSWTLAPGSPVPLPIGKLHPGATRLELRLSCAHGGCTDLRVRRAGSPDEHAPVRASDRQARFDLRLDPSGDRVPSFALTHRGDAPVTIAHFELSDRSAASAFLRPRILAGLGLATLLVSGFFVRAFRAADPPMPVDGPGGARIDGRARTIQWPARGRLRLLAGWGLVLFLALASVIRIVGVREGLPYFHHWDEGSIIERPVSALREGRLLFDSFNYPQLHSYVIAPAVAWSFRSSVERGEIDGWEDVRTGWAMGEDRIHPTSLYVSSRGISAVLGLLALFFLHRYVRALFSSATATLAVLFAALSLGHVISSWYLVLDGPAGAFAIGSLWFLARACRPGAPPRDFVALAFFTAVSMAIKYNHVVLVPTALLILALRRPPTDDTGSSGITVDRRRGVLLFGGALGVFFLILNPSLIFHPILTVEAALHEARLYRGDGVADGFGVFRAHLARFGEFLVLSNGVVLTALAAFGALSIVAMPDRRRGAFLMLFPLVMVAYMCGQMGKYFHRNLLVPALLANVLSALGFFFGVEALARYASPRTARIGTAALTAVVALALVGRLTVALDLTSAAIAPETRSRALAHLVEHSEGKPIWIDERVQLNLHDAWVREHTGEDPRAALRLRPYALEGLAAGSLEGPAWILAPANEHGTLEGRIPRAREVKHFEMAPGLGRRVEWLVGALGVPGPRQTTTTPIYSHNPTLHLYWLP